MRRKTVVLSAIVLATNFVTPCYGAWIQEKEKWIYLDSGDLQLVETWQLIEGYWYHFDSQGCMQTGWYQDQYGKWYFLNPVSNGLKGAMLTGWQWIDGKCYYLNPAQTEGFPQGSMYVSGQTPDHYFVDASGAWTSEDGQVQYIEGKGIKTSHQAVKSGKVSGGSFGRGSGGGSSSSSSNSNSSQEGKPQDKPQEPVRPEAKNVSWVLRFVEKGNPQNEIFKSQEGKTKEGEQLTIDFPETILALDRHYYHALVSSPYCITVNGAGIQKYTIEFIKGEEAPEEPDPDMGARDKLEKWLDTVRYSDQELTGIEPSINQMITTNRSESNERLLNLVSAVNDAESHEIYLIAKEHIPNALIISQTFDDVIQISELIMDQFGIEGEKYTVMRIGFTRVYDDESCTHDYITTDKVKPSCLDNGHETVRCKKCGREETAILPAAGHTDADHDGTCDICYEDASEAPESPCYNIGDVQARNISGKIYLFRCIDDDYEDAMNNSQKTALFLCDSVIRSDIDSTSTVFTKLSFGEDNSYKHSDVRKWLQKNADDSRFVHNSYIGITQAYIGSTEKGIYEQFDESSLTAYDREFQLMEDKVFCLSVEEAVKYREYLWRFHGSDANNPKSQLSAYSKGYYLRTPQKGAGIYAVDLIDGSIHPVEVTSTDIGLRPAMTIPQG